jgi:hypothetical protein
MNTDEDFKEYYLSIKQHIFEIFQEERVYNIEISYGIISPIKLILFNSEWRDRVVCELYINNINYNYATVLNYSATRALPLFNNSIDSMLRKISTYLNKNKVNLYMAYLDRLKPQCVVKQEGKPINSYFKQQFISLYNTVGIYDNCFICLETINKDTLYVRDCGHIHCNDCDKLLTKNECPVCRD